MIYDVMVAMALQQKVGIKSWSEMLDFQNHSQSVPSWLTESYGKTGIVQIIDVPQSILFNKSVLVNIRLDSLLRTTKIV